MSDLFMFLRFDNLLDLIIVEEFPLVMFPVRGLIFPQRKTLDGLEYQKDKLLGHLLCLLIRLKDSATEGKQFVLIVS